MTALDYSAIFLTLRLAALTTFILLVLGTPLAWALSQTSAWWKGPVNAIVALPFVLPPTVMGFYLLVLLGPNSTLGKLADALGISPLPFSFTGLVIASVCYSLPFAIQPLQNAFEAIGKRPLEAAATLRASPLDTFLTVILPLARPGYLTAAVMSFAHTIGEFGVVLMIGGNIPGKTQVLSIRIFDHVEAIEYAQAHWLSAGMLLFCFVTLLALYILNPCRKKA
ncbi:MAG: molybdate ABC transporter permease subunit [Burkholderiaceae bacterium]|jgi:molybdate transport system permease protein|nr:molybdate ABC transporter permease subunit [Burkholderiaceae bacterium]